MGHDNRLCCLWYSIGLGVLGLWVSMFNVFWVLWPLLTETCSYFLLLNTIINSYYHSCVVMTDIYLTISSFMSISSL